MAFPPDPPQNRATGFVDRKGVSMSGQRFAIDAMAIVR